MDQALEKAYKKPAEGPSGIISVSRKKKKETVCKWNIIMHEKGHFSYFFEYSFHHEFSHGITKQIRFVGSS